MNLHLASRHDWNCLGHLLDRYVDLEEMLQQTQFYGGTASGTFGSPYADSEPTQIHRAVPATNNQVTKSNAIHINISGRNSPKEGRDIGTIFEATSMTNFNKTPSAKTILL
jgi:hypothetical protein